VCHASITDDTYVRTLVVHLSSLQDSEVLKADLAREKAHTPAMPPNGADAKANDTVQHPPPKN
jgi:hypothetical protein